MKKNTQVATTLTTQQLEQSGIKTSLNQNDVVEIIATEAYDRIMNSLNNVQKFEDEDDALIKELEEDFKKELLKSKLLKMPLKDEVYTDYSNESENVKNFTRLRLDIEEDRTDGFIVRIIKKSYHKAFTSAINHEYRERIDSVLLENQGAFDKIYTEYHSKKFYKTYQYKSKYTPKQYQKKVDEYNKYIQSLYDSIPSIEKTTARNGIRKVVSYNSLVKQARVNVNRSIIKNQAPEVSEQINRLFGITL